LLLEDIREAEAKIPKKVLEAKERAVILYSIREEL